MLVFTRRSGEAFVLDTEDGEVTIFLEIRDGQVKVAIDAPETVVVFRKEIAEQFNDD